MTALPSRTATPKVPALPGFSHVRRYWSPQAGCWTAKILPGEYFVTHAAELITTILGSCISACIRDPVAGVGGMNHFMLPEDQSVGRNAWLEGAGSLATRYGSFAMESLVNELMKQGAERSRLEIKLFGGARILASMTDVGARNIEFIRRYLRVEGFRIAAEDLGADCPRHVEYFPPTGVVMLKRLKSLHIHDIAVQETRYRSRLQAPAPGNDVELFD